MILYVIILLIMFSAEVVDPSGLRLPPQLGLNANEITTQLEGVPHDSHNPDLVTLAQDEFAQGIEADRIKITDLMGRPFLNARLSDTSTWLSRSFGPSYDVRIGPSTNNGASITLRVVTAQEKRQEWRFRHGFGSYDALENTRATSPSLNLEYDNNGNLAYATNRQGDDARRWTKSRHERGADQPDLAISNPQHAGLVMIDRSAKALLNCLERAGSSSNQQVVSSVAEAEPAERHLTVPSPIENAQRLIEESQDLAPEVREDMSTYLLRLGNSLNEGEISSIEDLVHHFHRYGRVGSPDDTPLSPQAMNSGIDSVAATFGNFAQTNSSLPAHGAVGQLWKNMKWPVSALSGDLFLALPSAENPLQNGAMLLVIAGSPDNAAKQANTMRNLGNDSPIQGLMNDPPRIVATIAVRETSEGLQLANSGQNASNHDGDVQMLLAGIATNTGPWRSETIGTRWANTHDASSQLPLSARLLAGVLGRSR